jgi:uncharacterized flavoprotein (TIGR03862 family)
MNNPASPTLAVIGGGPAGLMAAEVARAAGIEVDLYDRMGSVGRKFLVAGKGGLNLTHSDAFERFVAHYGDRQPEVRRWLSAFDADAVRDWARGLGIETMVGSSGRVFPTDLKAAPLLRAWIRHLEECGVRFHRQYRWWGWNADGALVFRSEEGEQTLRTDAVVLALGGASWSILGSDGAWVPLLQEKGVEIATLQPSNCGFDIGWSEFFSQRYAGHALKPVSVTCRDRRGELRQRTGEIIITATGIEGGVIYALSAELRDTITADGSAQIFLDLAPGRDYERLLRDLSRPRGDRSLATHLRRNARIEGVKSGLLHEVIAKSDVSNMETLASTIKSLPLTLLRPRPIDEVISTAGGVAFAELDERLMLRKLPGVFCAGEMIDWEAPTGGFLLTACMASGRVAGAGAVEWLRRAE